MEFKGFPKIARLNRDIIITEKIDGTNAQVYIKELGDEEVMPTDTPIVAVVGKLLLYAGSRTRWITPEDDNYGFARWVKEHAEELVQLGTGQHFGEWWGQGIQRKYGLTEKRFSLFNTSRWGESRPSCCQVVPELYRGLFNTQIINSTLRALSETGSLAASGFMKPEGIVIFHTANNHLYKVTLEGDEKGKGEV